MGKLRGVLKLYFLPLTNWFTKRILVQKVKVTKILAFPTKGRQEILLGYQWTKRWSFSWWTGCGSQLQRGLFWALWWNLARCTQFEDSYFCKCKFLTLLWWFLESKWDTFGFFPLEVKEQTKKKNRRERPSSAAPNFRGISKNSNKAFRKKKTAESLLLSYSCSLDNHQTKLS